MDVRRVARLSLALVFAAGMGLALPRAGHSDAGRARAEVRVKDGDTAILLGKLEDARRAYQDALAADPGYAVAAVRLAFVTAQLGEDAEAVRLLETLTSSGKAPADAHQLLGAVRARRREWPQAAAAYEAYLKLEPSDHRARLELARAYRAQADGGTSRAADQALAEYARVIKDPGVDDATRALAQEEVLGLRYGDVGLAYLDGKVALANGDLRRAVASLETVVTKHPEIEEAQYLLGLAYASPEIGRRADALKAWEKAGSLREAQLQLGVSHHDDGDLENAERRLRKAIELDGAYQEAYFHLGRVLAERGSHEAATKAWERAVKLDPKSETGKWAATKLTLLTAQGSSVLQEGQVLDPSSEVALGQKVAEQVVGRFGLLDDPRLQARLEGVWTRLVAASDRGDLTYKLYLVRWDAVNAFTVPGGRVFICKGLIDVIRTRLGDKDEYYAAVLAHELAHATLRHVPEGIRLSQVAGNDPAMAAEFQRSVERLATGMTRNAEYEADQFGALYMVRAGYAPKYAIELHAGFARIVGEIPPGLDHPTFADRQARLRDFLIDVRGRVREFELGNKAFAAGDYARAVAHYELFLALLPRSAPGHLNLGLALHRQGTIRLGIEPRYRRTTDLDPDARVAAIEVRSSASGPRVDPRLDRRLLREAAAEYRLALRLDPGYALARVNYGALLLDLGEVKTATKVLELATRRAPRSAAAWNNLGTAYAAARDVKRSEAALRKAAALDPKLPDPWFNLGMLLAGAGKAELGIAAFDEAARRDSASGWAKVARARRAELQRAGK